LKRGKEKEKAIPVEEIIRAAEEKGLTEDDIEEALQKLKRTGDIFEPRRGHYQRG